MKNYIAFIASFVMLMLVLQVGSSMLLTMLYEPGLTEEVGTLGSTVTFGESTYMFPLVVAMLAATISFFISKRLS
ncbi:hypothetical protein [Priestia flexa]|uniref:hypothetical protein n=1 Tax=Priestia flexa TaxID=86664 RepID=UPI001A8D2AE9|nr:hypothetical protein [Priestia flexa]MBN8435115.1 hypothetical protein [Priestia flexa]MCA0967383.1 hypothetical protein [Priestia flexa]